VLIDDHPASRTPLVALLNRQPDLRVVAEADSVAQAKEIIEAGLQCNVAVIDLDLGDGSGIEIVRLLRSVSPATQILVLTGLRDDRARGQALYEGAAGAMLKSVSTQELIDAVRALGHQQAAIAPDEAIRLMRVWIDELKIEWNFERAVTTLTARERQVLPALTDGLSDEEIACQYGMSVATTRSHVRAILSKLGVESRLKAVVLAFRAGHFLPR
jgi:DNA-binding NarL/FixJ family response regulator